VAATIKPKVKGVFLTFEGPEGAGKSTQIKLLTQYLYEKGKDVLLLREPGGVVISEKIRSILLDKENKAMCNECEILLYMAARAQLVEEIIKPALIEGKIVVCDRFLDSTIAYQGYGNSGDLDKIKTIGRWIVQDCFPELTIVFDIDPKEGLSRISGDKDRIESKSLEYHKKVRQGYQALAKEEPQRVKLVSGKGNIDKIFDEVKAYVEEII